MASASILDTPPTPPLNETDKKETKEELEDVVKETDPHMLLRLSGSLNRSKTLLELSGMDVPQLQNKLFSEFGIRTLTGRTKTELIKEVQYEKRLAGQPWYVTYLPHELLILMMSFLDYTDLLQVAQTCYHWNYISSDDGLWKSVLNRNANIIMPRFGHIKNWTGPTPTPTLSSTASSSSSSSSSKNAKANEKINSGLRNDFIMSQTTPDTSAFPSYKARARDLFESCCYYCKNYAPQKHETLKIRLCAKCPRKSGWIRSVNLLKHKYHLEFRDLRDIKKVARNYYRAEDVEDKAAAVFGSLAIALDPLRWKAKREEIENTYERRKELKYELKKYGLILDNILEPNENLEYDHPHYEICNSYLMTATPEIEHIIDLITKAERRSRRDELLDEIRKLNEKVDTSALGNYEEKKQFERYLLRGGDVTEVANKMWASKVFEHRKALLKTALKTANINISVTPRVCQAFSDYLGGKNNATPQETIDAYLVRIEEKRKAMEDAKIERQKTLLELREKEKQHKLELKKTKKKEKEERARLAQEKKEAKERQKAEKLKAENEENGELPIDGDVNNNNTTSTTASKGKGKGKRKVEESEEEEEEEETVTSEKGKKKAKGNDNNNNNNNNNNNSNGGEGSSAPKKAKGKERVYVETGNERRSKRIKK